MTALDLITAALRRIGVLNATDAPSAEDADLALQTLTLLFESWATKGVWAYTTVALADTLTLPKGARPALLLTLAEQIAPSFRVAVDPILVRDAAQARADYFASARRAPALETRDSGLPDGEPNLGDILTGRSV